MNDRLQHLAQDVAARSHPFLRVFPALSYASSSAVLRRRINTIATIRIRTPARIAQTAGEMPLALGRSSTAGTGHGPKREPYLADAAPALERVAVRLRLRDVALEPIRAPGREDRVVPHHRVGGVLVEDLLRLVHDLPAFVLVRRDELILIQLVVLGIAVVRVVVPVRVAVGRPLVTREQGELGTGIRVGVPAPREQLVVARVDDVGELGRVQRGHLGLDPDLLEPLGHERSGVDRGLLVRPHEVTEIERPSRVHRVGGHLADAVAVRVDVAGILEELFGTLDVGAELVGPRGLPAGAGHRDRRDDRVTRHAVAEHDLFVQLPGCRSPSGSHAARPHP